MPKCQCCPCSKRQRPPLSVKSDKKAHPPLTRRPCVWYYSINFISLSKTLKRSSIRSAAEHRERPTLGTPRPHAGEVASESRTQRNTRPAAPRKSGSPAALPSRLRRALPTLQGTGNRRAAGAVLDLGLSASRRARARHRARTQVVPRGKTASCCREIGGRAFFCCSRGLRLPGAAGFPPGRAFSPFQPSRLYPASGVRTRPLPAASSPACGRPLSRGAYFFDKRDSSFRRLLS